jgi:uncharacterized protein (DUF2384 family)
MANVNAYVPDDDWERYKELRRRLRRDEGEEQANVSRVVQVALRVAIKQMEEILAEKGEK